MNVLESAPEGIGGGSTPFFTRGARAGARPGGTRTANWNRRSTRIRPRRRRERSYGCAGGGVRSRRVELAECAEEMAARFAAGGRLFSFGNGGSSTDAQEVATAFLHPLATARPCPLSA